MALNAEIIHAFNKLGQNEQNYQYNLKKFS